MGYLSQTLGHQSVLVLLHTPCVASVHVRFNRLMSCSLPRLLVPRSKRTLRITLSAQPSRTGVILHPIESHREGIQSQVSVGGTPGRRRKYNPNAAHPIHSFVQFYAPLDCGFRGSIGKKVSYQGAQSNTTTCIHQNGSMFSPIPPPFLLLPSNLLES
ncbi:hypothetical protein B0H63DRAFT_484023 [Podospora didyma]|uniref:Uncharacterized protein n=1 Tax=Podospora didyma TaxID=330526 RepID=A0AAE0N6L2_9PEZI|nr:hypothetical protein B0H63DRAFT_484023 [Podospora didyma]